MRNRITNYMNLNQEAEEIKEIKKSYEHPLAGAHELREIMNDIERIKRIKENLVEEFKKINKSKDWEKDK